MGGWVGPPRRLFPMRSGRAGCVFLTGNEEPDSVWVITNRDSEKYEMEIIKVTPWTTVAKISISLRQNEQAGTDAKVTYTYTALSEAGKDFVNNYTESYYANSCATGKPPSTTTSYPKSIRIVLERGSFR